MAAKETCSECGCRCSRCDSHGLHLHREIEALKQRVIERDFHILRLETAVLREADRFPHGEVGELRAQMAQWQDKYDRLLESYKKLQRVNQNLEDKLLRIVDKYETDKTALGQDVGNLTKHLVSARTELNRHRDLGERYRTDLHLAIQLLQCKPSAFISRRLETLPVDLQQKVKACLNTHQKQARKPDYKVIKVPISTFPPTAMVYAVDKTKDVEEPEPDAGEDERVSAAILARVLQEREQERTAGCGCGRGHPAPRQVDVSVQTRPPHIGARDALSQPFVYEPGRRGGGAGACQELSRPRQASSESPPARHTPGSDTRPCGDDRAAAASAAVVSAAAWWAAATEPGGADWDVAWDVSPARSGGASMVSSGIGADSVSSGDSTAAGSSTNAPAQPATLRMETRI